MSLKCFLTQENARANRIIKMLLIEPDIGDEYRIQESLNGSRMMQFMITSAQTIDEAFETCMIEKYDLIMVDVFSCEFKPQQAIEKLRELQPDAGIIVLSDEDEMECRDMIAYGATDSIDKNLPLEFVLGHTIATSLQRMEMAKKIGELQKHASMLLNTVQAGVVLIDEKTREIIDVNPAAAEVIGLSKDEICGKICHKFICPADIDQCPVCDLHQEVDKSERLLLRGDGSEVPILKTAKRITVDGRQCILDTFLDIRELKRYEEELLLHEQTLSAIIDNIPGAVFRRWPMRLENPEFLTDTIENLTGHSPKHFQGGEVQFVDLVHPEDREILQKAIESALEENRQYRIDYRLVNEDGQVLWVVERGKAVLGEGEAAAYLNGVILDCSDRKAIENELEEAKNRYASVVENIGVGVSLIGPNMEILSLNKKMREWFPEVDPGQKPICFKSFNNPPKNEPCHNCPTRKTLKDGQVHEIVQETPRGDGVNFYFRIQASPIVNQQGEIVAAIELVEDVTDVIMLSGHHSGDIDNNNDTLVF